MKGTGSVRKDFSFCCDLIERGGGRWATVLLNASDPPIKKSTIINLLETARIKQLQWRRLTLHVVGITTFLLCSLSYP